MNRRPFLRQTLDLRLSQRLALTPSLLQKIELLQLNKLELQEMLNQELVENPILEEVADQEPPAETVLGDRGPEEMAPAEDAPPQGERDSFDEIDFKYFFDEYLDTGYRNREVEDTEKASFETFLTRAPSLEEHLNWQLGLSDAGPRLAEIARHIIGNIDEDGYLVLSLEDLCAVAACTMEEAVEALQRVQAFDPLGVGARDLRECLLLQLPADDPDHALARRLVADHIESVAQNRLAAIADHIDAELEDVEDAVRLIRTLNPCPGQALVADEPVCTVTPDVVIRLDENGEFEIEIVERNVPRLRISHSCRALIEKGSLSRADLAYVRNRIRSAMFVIEGLRKREATMRRITEEIVRIQHRYLRGEETEIRPLTMAKVAAIIGVHDTTVSRALAEKYVETPVGVLPMRHFFQAGYQCDDGSALTPDMVRQRIHAIIAAEDPATPIKDEDIAEILKKDGIPVARRTVAKYRGELGVGSSKERVGHAPMRLAPRPEPAEAAEAEAAEVEEAELVLV